MYKISSLLVSWLQMNVEIANASFI
eukprot:COSAG02_NODE_34366_length_485_cov_0.805699_1_plen_24_part_01